MDLTLGSSESSPIAVAKGSMAEDRWLINFEHPTYRIPGQFFLFGGIFVLQLLEASFSAPKIPLPHLVSNSLPTYKCHGNITL